jgi:hypothetical protein
MTDTKGLRMYFFVMGNLSGIQKGIQCGHAALEYYLKYGVTIPEYKDFIENHKTFILLDGGGSGDMYERRSELEEFGIHYASFFEPDLNNSLSAIAFIVPEEIYGRKVDQYYIDNLDTLVKEERIALYLKGFRLASN